MRTRPVPDLATPAPASAPHRDPAPQARRGPVGARLPRAAEHQRAVQEGRRPAQRPGPDREHLLQARLRLDRPGRPARPVPLVGPLHPARARASTAARPRCSSRRSSTTSTSCCGSASTAALLGADAAARPRRASSTDVRPRHRRRHRPAEHPVPLDPDRGRPRDLGAARGGRAEHRRRPAATRPRPFLGSPVAGVAADEIIDGTAGARRDQARATSATRSSPTCRASSRPRSPATRSHDVAPEVNDVVVRRHRAPRARPRLRPVGRRRAVHQPDARPEARRLDPARRGRRRLGGRRRRSSATTATAGCAPAPG